MNKKNLLARGIPILLAILSAFLFSGLVLAQEKVPTSAVDFRVDVDQKDTTTGEVTAPLGSTINISTMALNKDNETATDAENQGATLRVMISSIFGQVDAGLPSRTADGDANLDTGTGTTAGEGQYAVFPETRLNVNTTRTNELRNEGAVPVVSGVGAVNISYLTTGRTGDDTVTVIIGRLAVPPGKKGHGKILGL